MSSDKFKDSKIYDIAKLLFRDRPYLNDKKQIEIIYKQRFNKKLDLNNPRTFNEKNNWRKLYERNKLYTELVDKYKLKDYVKEKYKDGHTIKLIKVYDSVNDINLNELPDKFVLKTNHANGILVCKDKTTFNLDKAKKILFKKLKENYFLRNREWPYKNVERKILAEEYVGDNLMDYKNYCFNGKLEYTFVWKNISNEEGTKPTAYFIGAYDRNWNKTDLKLDYPSLNEEISKPKQYDELIKISESLSKDIPFVRVDTYIINNNIYVGEMTFFPWGGYQKFIDESWNVKLGDMIKLK